MNIDSEHIHWMYLFPSLPAQECATAGGAEKNLLRFYGSRMNQLDRPGSKIELE
jgi:hypothetical protein